jgi:anaerobic ribonucleoside-triphosphate reductase activating protein
MSVENHEYYTDKLNIASFAINTHALGPGNRAVVWTQGCPLNCPGCVAPSWIANTEALLFTPGDLLNKFDIEAIDGFTFSGGEPMEQAGGLASLIRLAREKKDLNLICFTGYRYERLLKNPPNPGVEELISEVDVLIDGPYVQSKNNSVGLRGSANQRILRLTSRLDDYDFENQKRNLEVTVRDGELSFVGIPTPEIKLALDQVFHSGAGRMD